MLRRGWWICRRCLHNKTPSQQTIEGRKRYIDFSRKVQVEDRDASVRRILYARDLVVGCLALWHDIAWGWEEVLLWSGDWVDLDWVAVGERVSSCWVVIYEWGVLARGLWVSPVLVLMVDTSMDDLIVDHSGKVLETVELDGLVVGVQDDWVGALTASAG